MIVSDGVVPAGPGRVEDADLDPDVSVGVLIETRTVPAASRTRTIPPVVVSAPRSVVTTSLAGATPSNGSMAVVFRGNVCVSWDGPAGPIRIRTGSPWPTHTSADDRASPRAIDGRSGRISRLWIRIAC